MGREKTCKDAVSRLVTIVFYLAPFGKEQRYPEYPQRAHRKCRNWLGKSGVDWSRRGQGGRNAAGRISTKKKQMSKAKDFYRFCCHEATAIALVFGLNGRDLRNTRVGIRCTAVEEFSRRARLGRSHAKGSERDQLLGVARERRGPCKMWLSKTISARRSLWRWIRFVA